MRIRIVRDRIAARSAKRSRLALAAAVLGASALWIMPLAASRVPASSLTVALEDPSPLDGSDDLAQVLGVGAGDPAFAAPEAASFPAAFPNSAGPDSLTPEELQPYAPPSQFAAGPAAAPYIFRSRNATDNLRAIMCLTAAIYYEAANEPDDGQRAVAQVVLNRVRHPAFPNTVCGVVYQGTERNDTLCQFTFGCDGALARRPTAIGWARARRVAQAALGGSVFGPVGMATNYHTLAVSPSWGRTLAPTGIFGAHIFYRLPGGAGEPRSFHASYRGFEPLPGPKPKLAPPPLPPLIMAANGAQMVPLPQGVLPVAIAPGPGAVVALPAPPVRSVAADKRYVPGTLPESDVNPAYRNSGEWIARP